MVGNLSLTVQSEVIKLSTIETLSSVNPPIIPINLPNREVMEHNIDRCIIGVSLCEPHTSVVYRNTCIDQPTDQPTDQLCPSHHVLWIHCMCPHTLAHHVRPCRSCVVVNSTVRSGDSYKTKNGNNGKAKS